MTGRRPERRRRVWPAALLAVVLALAVGLAACSSGSAAPAATAPAAPSSPPTGTADPATDPALARFYDQKPAWSGCRSGFECATVTVPLDWAQPAGRTVSLALIRLPATGHRIGSLLFNPGGPGVSAVDWLRTSRGAKFERPLRDAFDVVTWDPRGVGSSTPVRCLDNAQMDTFLSQDGTPDTPSEQAQGVQEARDFAAACQQNTGPLLAHVDTISDARDLDVIRAVLGERVTNYYGWSYGTFLGEWYAQLFGWRVGRMVLDGVVDPSLTGAQYAQGQAQGFARMARAFVDDCLARDGCPLRGTRDQAFSQVEQLVKQTDGAPLPTDSGRRLTEALMTTGIEYALYYPEMWEVLRQALTQAFRGDGTGLLVLADGYNERDRNGTYAPTLQVTVAIGCLDRPDGRTIEQVAATSARFAQLYRPLGASLGWSGLGCVVWPIRPVVPPQRIAAPQAPPLLVVGTVGDPATPYEWAQSVAAQMTSAHLVTYDGDGHTAYHRGSDCIDGTVNAYLLAGTIPRPGLRCG